MKHFIKVVAIALVVITISNLFMPKEEKIAPINEEEITNTLVVWKE